MEIAKEVPVRLVFPVYGVNNHGHGIIDSMYMLYIHLDRYYLFDKPLCVTIKEEAGKSIIPSCLSVLKKLLKPTDTFEVVFEVPNIFAATHMWTMDSKMTNIIEKMSILDCVTSSGSGISTANGVTKGDGIHLWTISKTAQSVMFQRYIDFIVKAFGLEHIEQEPKLVTIASRKDKYRGRKLLNEEDVAKVYRENGFQVEIFDFDDWELPNQIRQMRRSTYFVSTYGSNLVNGIFLPRNGSSRVHTLWPNQFARNALWKAASPPFVEVAILSCGIPVYDVHHPFAGDYPPRPKEDTEAIGKASWWPLLVVDFHADLEQIRNVASPGYICTSTTEIDLPDSRTKEEKALENREIINLVKSQVCSTTKTLELLEKYCGNTKEQNKGMLSDQETHDVLVKMCDEPNGFFISRLGGSDYDQIVTTSLNFDRAFITCCQYNGYFDNDAKSPEEKQTRFMQYLDVLKTSYRNSPLKSRACSGSDVIPWQDELLNTKQSFSYHTFIECTWPFLQLFKVIAEKKTVLVVSPFSKTITLQMQNRKDLLLNYEWPDFNLLVYNTPITYNNPALNEKATHARTSHWYSELQLMCEEIALLKFDICLLACASYAAGLGDFISTKMNRKAFYIGGVLNVMFNIHGSRYVQAPFTLIMNPARRMVALEANDYDDVSGGRHTALEAFRAYF